MYNFLYSKKTLYWFKAYSYVQAVCEFFWELPHINTICAGEA